MWHVRSNPSGFPTSFAGWWPAAWAALLWALAAGSALAWWLQLSDRSAGPLAVVASSAPAPVSDRAALARALGQVSVVVAAPDVQKRFVLLGVIAGDSGRGSALLAIDGQPSQAFVQGQQVAEGWRLERVLAEGVRLAPMQGAGGLELSMPVRP